MFNSIWYENLIRPPFSPPNQIFMPVWTFLYITILIAFILYLFKKAQNKKCGYTYFFIQIILNFAWSPVFFYFKQIFWAFIIIIFLDIFVFLTIKKFYSIQKISGLILTPYFLWIIFATYLNIGYLVLN